MKRIILTIISIIVVAALCFGSAVCVVADDTYGTEADGIYTKPWTTHLIKSMPEFMNGDFEQGLKYWARNYSDAEGFPSGVVDLKEENGNKYISFNSKAEWDGIISPRFQIEGVKIDQQLVLIYDWRGVSDFNVYLRQMRMNADETGCIYEDEGTGFGASSDIVLADGLGEVLKEATNDQEWNTSMSNPHKVVAEASAVNPALYFFICAQVTTDRDVEADIDNIRVGIYRANEQKVYATDGTTVLFDLNVEQEEEEIEDDYEEEDTDSDSDDDADVDADTDSDAENADDDAEADTDGESEDDSASSNLILWICIGAGIIVIAAAVLVVLFILKNKKNADAGEQETPQDD